MISQLSLLLAGIYAAAIALVIALNATLLGDRFALRDIPGGRKIHDRPTPLMGGLALLLGLVPILFAYMMSHEPEGIGHWALGGFAITTFGCTLVGLADDHKPYGAKLRFLLIFGLFGSLLAFEPRFSLSLLYFSGLPAPIMLGRVIGGIFTLLVLLGFVNAVNMADGKNGLVLGLSIIWASIIVRSGPAGLIPVLIPLIAMLCVLMIFNLRGRLFLGDGGTYGLAALIGLSATYSYNFQGGLMAADQLVLLFLIPITDMMRLIVERLYSGKSPMMADRNHLHHHLLELFGWPGGLLFYCLLVAVPNAIAVASPSRAPTLIVMTLVGYGGVLLFRIVRGRARATLAEPPSR